MTLEHLPEDHDLGLQHDIRSSFGSSTTTAPGVPLTHTITVVNSNAACSPLVCYAIYIWHCDRSGHYSLYTAPTENYLRGVKVADSNGQVTFESIYPACYSGRYPHIQFETYPSLASATVYTDNILTSQMAMPSDICTEVYNGATGYNASVAHFSQISIATDNVFGDNTDAQIALQTPSLAGSVANGYACTIQVGVPV